MKNIRVKMNDNIIRKLEVQLKEDRFQHIIDALQDEGISPELRERMQRHICSHGTDEQWEEAFLRYAEKFEPAEFRLDDRGLESYNKLAAELGLRQISEKEAADVGPEDIRAIKACFASDSKPEPLRRSRRRPVYWRVAAVLIPIAVIVSLRFLADRPYEREVSIASSEHVQQTLLPDSTLIVVEPGGSVVYRETDHSRDVALSGHAFFKVERDESRPFNIAAGDMELTVLGTDLSVCETVGVVSLFEGSVCVRTENSVDTLAWGDRLTLDATRGSVRISVIPASEMMANGYKPRLRFDRATLSEVLQALSAYYDVAIETDPALDSIDGALTVDFDGGTLEDALALLVKMYKPRMRYGIEEDKVTISI